MLNNFKASFVCFYTLVVSKKVDYCQNQGVVIFLTGVFVL